MDRQIVWFWSQKKQPGDLMTQGSFVINVGKVTGGEGQLARLLKLWKRDYYPLIAVCHWTTSCYIGFARILGFK